MAPTTVHPTIDKAAHYFGLKVVHTPVGADFKADVQAMKEVRIPSFNLIKHLKKRRNYHIQFKHKHEHFTYVTGLTRRVSLVAQELITLPEHMSSPPGFSGFPFTRSLVLFVCFVDRCLSFCTFSVGHCVVCSSSIYDF